MDMVLNGEKNEARHKLETSDLFVLTAGVALVLRRTTEAE